MFGKSSIVPTLAHNERERGEEREIGKNNLKQCNNNLDQSPQVIITYDQS